MNANSKVEFFGDIQTPAYIGEVKTDGIQSTFHKGIIYRHPGAVPMLEVCGDHYEMGLQYGMLLRPEILSSVDSFDKILNWYALKMDVPVEALISDFKARSKRLLVNLPQRFVQELKGISDGSGVPFDAVAACSLVYDILMGMECTGVLMKGENDKIFHGRNNDTRGFGGEELGKMTVVVRHKADGYNAVTHMDNPFFLGVETGYSDQGLAFSEETLSIKNPNPDGFSLVYLVRMIMEECSSLDELPEYFKHYPVVGAYGTVWSDQKTGRGLVAELTPTAWEIIEMDGSILWNFNHIYSENLVAQQTARVNLSPDPDREAVATTYHQKDLYEVEDAVSFLRLQVGPEADDYSHYGTRNPICNKSGTQMMVFHPEGDGVYLGLGVYYAARQNIYHYHDDFSKTPELFMEAVPMKPVLVETARIENLLLDNEGYRDAFIDLSKKYRDDANIHFLAALYSFKSKSLEQYAEFAKMAFKLSHIAEYRLFAGIAAYFKRSFSEAIELLEQIAPAGLYDRNEVLRLYVLAKALEETGDEKCEDYHDRLQRLLEVHDGQEYFIQAYLPYLD